MPKVLVVDDEESVRQMLKDVLEADGHRVILAQDGRSALSKIDTTDPDAVLLDIRMPEIDGMAVLDIVRGKGNNVPIILMTAFGTTDMAIQAMQMGAYDYVIKPFNIDELLLTVKKAVVMQDLVAEVTSLREELAHNQNESMLLGQSPRMQALYKDIGRVADRNVTVLILGESGTGKELVSWAIHRNSSRRDRPFVKINCATIPENLLESELFGHEKGSFTSADRRKQGKFELANRGTILLDEIGEISMSTQVKLLRVLQEKEFERVGGTETLKVDVRILAATNKDLARLVKEGGFREDLFFRLNVVSIWVPPLRERREDIPFLANHFVQKFRGEFNKQITGFSQEAMDLLCRYDWPGNVRELKNACQRAVVMSTGQVILPDDIPFSVQARNQGVETPEYSPGMTLKEIVSDVERQVILKVLQENNWNRSTTAEALGINRRSLYAKMKEYGLI
ncbi:MAG: sigma-54-dependent transcriptional regulator [Eubacteriales bacterium]